MSVRITVNNIGPLRKAEAELKPLTLLVGPNDSGKSTLATVVYAALSAGQRSVGMNAAWEGFLVRPRTNREFADFIRSKYGREIAVGSPESTKTPADLLPALKRQVEESLHAYARELTQQLERAFGDGFASLVRMQGQRRAPAKLIIEHSSPEWRIEIRSRDQEIMPPTDQVLLDWLSGAPPRGIAGAAFQTWRLTGEPHQQSRVYRQTGDLIFPGLLPLLFRGFPHSTSYLPAARSGFLQSHRLLASSLVRQASRVGVEDLGVPRLTGIVSDFISQLLELSPSGKRGPFDDATDELERSVLGGEITITEGPASYPEISYRVGNVSLPLHRTSSMVSELAPVILYLRYVLRPGDMLLIEEPEAHLHPESQIILANTLARLVSEGLQVVLTTHSDYFLQQLNNTIMAAALEPGATTRDDVLTLPKLPADQVAAYRFRPDADKGTTTRELPVQPREGGVSDQDFAEVTEAQYDQTVEIDRRLIDAG